MLQDTQISAWFWNLYFLQQSSFHHTPAMCLGPCQALTGIHMVPALERFSVKWGNGKIRTPLGQGEKSARRGARASSHEEPVWMQPLASAGYLLAQHSHALAGDSPRPALPPRALQKLRAPKSRGDPPDSWQPANCICNPSLCGYKNAGSHLKRTY